MDDVVWILSKLPMDIINMIAEYNPETLLLIPQVKDWKKRCQRFNISNIDNRNWHVTYYMLCQESRYIDRISGRLKQIFGDNYDAVKQLMISEHAVISGSFVLQCILDESWKSDVDIYIPVTGHQTLFGNPTSNLETYLFSKYDCTYSQSGTSYLNVISGIEWIREYDVSGTTLQVIIMNSDVISNFDLDICKNTYDIEKNSIHMHNEQSIFNRHANWNLQVIDRAHVTIDRCYKYMKRGFKITIPDNTYDIIKKAYNSDDELTICIVDVIKATPEYSGYNRLLFYSQTDKFIFLSSTNSYHAHYTPKYIVTGAAVHIPKQDCQCHCDMDNCPAAFLSLNHFHFYFKHQIKHKGYKNLIIRVL